MFRKLMRLSAVVLVVAGIGASTRTAQAVPSFAAQTGYACTQCHIGGYGPQLTPFGRAFKIGGYTQGGGEGWAANVPLSAMVLGSFSATNGNQPEGTQPTHFGTNNNPALDQISVFLAGRVTDFAGLFSQYTYNGVGVSEAVDNTDIRPFTTLLDVGGNDLRVGISVNNNPTVQDPYNSTFAWGFPYVKSVVVPTPAASPVLTGAFAANSVGVTGYAWYDKTIYVEAGGYETWGPTALSTFGEAYGPGATSRPAPYLRGAYEWNWNGQSAHVGGIYFGSSVYPATGSFTSTGAFGTDTYNDLAIDGGYQWLGDGSRVATVYGIYTHEWQDLKATAASGGAAFASHDLNDMRANTQYWFDQTYGLIVGWDYTWGKGDPVLYAPAPVTGSAKGKPNSNSFTFEADWVPFGKEGSWGAPFANLRFGAQYVLYTQFNGGNANYDGFGRGAADNNTLYLFAWLIF